MADRWICLSRKHDIWTVIDEEDWPFISQWNWNYGKAGHCNKIYAKRNEGPERRTILMHRALLFHRCPLPTCMQGYDDRGARKYVGDHEDGDSLNNRLSTNLRWISKSQDISNSWRNRFTKEGELLSSSLRKKALTSMGLEPELFEDLPCRDLSSILREEPLVI